MARLAGKVAIITGAAGGQGAATAALFAEHGAKVVIADIAEDDGRSVAAKIGTDALFHRLDITDERSWTTLVDATVARWGRIDILVNNAAIVHYASILEISAADFEQVYRVNVVGAFLGIKWTAPVMIGQGGGAIVNIGSTAGLWGMNGLAAYSASKWGLRGLTRAAAMELGHRGVRINTIVPGGINTRMTNSDNGPAEALNKDFQKQPIQRIGEPEEVARASLFIASDEASYICGAELTVDGGMTLGKYIDFMAGSPDQ